MPHFCFINDPNQVVPVGCVERVCCYSPYTKHGDGRAMTALDAAQAAWVLLQKFFL